MKETEQDKRLYLSQGSVSKDAKENGNLFFFTDYEYFKSKSNYTYIGKKEPTKGFVFGLIFL